MTTTETPNDAASRPDGSAKHFDPDIVDAFLACEREFVRIKAQFDEPLETTGASGPALPALPDALPLPLPA